MGIKYKYYLNIMLTSLSSGDARMVKAKKNIFFSFLIKGLSILISLILVPLTLGYLNSYEYGVWLTLSSVLMWINFFDVGLGNGLRNRLTEALAVGNNKLGQIYVSTTFFILTILMIVIFSFFLILQHFIDWSHVLNVSPDIVGNLNSLIIIVFAFFCLSFVFKFIGNVYLANQLPMVNDLLQLLGSVLSLIIIYILKLYTNGDLSKIAITYSITPVLVYLLAYPVTFYGKYKHLRPVFSAIKIKYAKDLMGLGLQFFLIQIACLIIFTTSNILISQLFGPEQVTPYNIAFKYFSVITMLFNILITPMWSAITDAYVNQDLNWIKKSIRKMTQVWVLLLVVTIVMILVCNYVYSLWVGKDIVISISLSILTGLYVTIANWNNIFAFCLNGIGKVRLQLYTAVVSGVLYIPFAIILSKYWGISGIMAAMCLVLLTSAVFLPIQYKKIIDKRARGIWFK